MKERFVLEERITDAWCIFDDLKVLRDNADDLSEDEFYNILNGLLDLGEIKMQMLWKSFEKCVKDKHL